MTGRPFHRIRKLRRMGRRHRHHRHAAGTGQRPGRRNADSGVRISQIAGRRMQPADLRLGARIVQPEAVEQAARAVPDGSATVIRPV